MAEINTSSGNNRYKDRLRRWKKLTTKVDLTPMVDLGFLLITFFVFTISMSKPTSMKLYLPAGKDKNTPTGNSTALTIIPISNNKVFYYHGDLEKAIKSGLSGTTDLSVANGIGNIIRQKQFSLDHSEKFTRKDLMLIIKPSADCSYKDIVAALDEVLINNLKHYALVDLDTEEKQWMQKQTVK